MRDLEKFNEYKKQVKKSKEKILLNGERYFYRPNPNQIHLYETAWQVGIGKEKEKLIDHHVAKVWNEDEAMLIVDALNRG